MASRRSVRREISLPAPDSPVRLSRVGVRRASCVLAITGTTGALDSALSQLVLPAFKVAVEVAASEGAVVVTGGTDAGVFHLFGLALSSAPRRPRVVLGVAPDDLVADATSPPGEGRSPVDPELTALVRVPGREWGDETGTLSRLVDQIAGSKPAVVLLAGGGEVTRAETVEHLSRGRDLVVLSGSGRFADEVAAGRADIADPDLRALLSSGRVRIVPVDDATGELSRVLEALLQRPRRRSLRRRIPVLSVFPRLRFRPASPPHPLARSAVSRYPSLQPRLTEADKVIYPAYASCDEDAQAEQNRYRWLVVLSILGGLLTTTFGAVQAWLQSVAWPGIVVVTLGAATSAVTMVARRQGSLDNYLTARIRAERLRSLYFQYLAKPPESSEAIHRQQLRELEERAAEIESGPVT